MVCQCFQRYPRELSTSDSLVFEFGLHWKSRATSHWEPTYIAQDKSQLGAQLTEESRVYFYFRANECFYRGNAGVTPSWPGPVHHVIALQVLWHVKLSKSVASSANWGRSREPAASSVFFTFIPGNEPPLGNIVLLQWAVNGRKGKFYLIYVLCLMKYKYTVWLNTLGSFASVKNSALFSLQ